MLTITGSGFRTGATVSFEGLSEAPPQVLAVNVVSDTTMQVSILATDDARAVDAWDVRVTNPDGTTARLMGAFTIMP